MGVWIETQILELRIKQNDMSHPVWVCGLKPDINGDWYKGNIVTPCMGVWIETRYEG